MLYELRADGTMVADWDLEAVKDTLPLLTERAARVDVPTIDRDVLDRLDDEDSDLLSDDMMPAPVIPIDDMEPADNAPSVPNWWDSSDDDGSTRGLSTSAPLHDQGYAEWLEWLDGILADNAPPVPSGWESIDGGGSIGDRDRP